MEDRGEGGALRYSPGAVIGASSSAYGFVAVGAAATVAAIGEIETTSHRLFDVE